MRRISDSVHGTHRFSHPRRAAPGIRALALLSTLSLASAAVPLPAPGLTDAVDALSARIGGAVTAEDCSESAAAFGDGLIEIRGVYRRSGAPGEAPTLVPWVELLSELADAWKDAPHCSTGRDVVVPLLLAFAAALRRAGEANGADPPADHVLPRALRDLPVACLLSTPSGVGAVLPISAHPVALWLPSQGAHEASAEFSELSADGRALRLLRPTALGKPWVGPLAASGRLRERRVQIVVRSRGVLLGTAETTCTW